MKPRTTKTLIAAGVMCIVLIMAITLTMKLTTAISCNNLDLNNDTYINAQDKAILIKCLNGIEGNYTCPENANAQLKAEMIKVLNTLETCEWEDNIIYHILDLNRDGYINAQDKAILYKCLNGLEKDYICPENANAQMKAEMIKALNGLGIYGQQDLENITEVENITELVETPIETQVQSSGSGYSGGGGTYYPELDLRNKKNETPVQVQVQAEPETQSQTEIPVQEDKPFPWGMIWMIICLIGTAGIIIYSIWKEKSELNEAGGKNDKFK